MIEASGGWRIGVDTGGTFTDLVAVSATGEVRLRKVSSTPPQPSAAVFQALERTGIDLAADLDYFALGTTIATNAVIQRSGARTLFVTTAGFEDNLYIQRIDRKGLYDLQWVKAVPYAARHDTFGVRERILSDGSIRTPLTDDEVARVVAAIGQRLSEAPGAAVAISFLFSYVNAVHEQRVADALRAAIPGVMVSISSQVAPIWREYERSSTTVMDAYVKPIVRRFAEDIESGLASRHVSGWHALMRSNGGQVPVAHAADRPCEMVLSGLAGGMIAGNFWARAVGSDRAVTLDMGGTSADVGVVVDGQLKFSGLFEVEFGIPVALPIIDVTTIGAGGSSIAAIDFGGLLRVGPESAGADPGPACYGRGGTAPTITDANLVMGRLDPGYFLGGEITLDAARSEVAVAALAEPLGLSTADAADAILSVSIENMAGAVRLVTVDRGYDYREFDLVAFGGAGPLHAARSPAGWACAGWWCHPRPGLSPHSGRSSPTSGSTGERRCCGGWTGRRRRTSPPSCRAWPRAWPTSWPDSAATRTPRSCSRPRSPAATWARTTSRRCACTRATSTAASSWPSRSHPTRPISLPVSRTASTPSIGRPTDTTCRTSRSSRCTWGRRPTSSPSR